MGCPWELLYIDGLMIIAKFLGDLLLKVEIRKSGMEKKGLCVNMETIKVLVPCAVCLKGTCNNATVVSLRKTVVYKGPILSRPRV